MGNCCRSMSEELVDSEVKEETEEEQREVKARGFVQKRRCTDVLCLIIWAVHVVVFIVVSFIGFQDGDPTKLYKPRDYQGAYCGAASNWNGGPNLEAYTKQGFMMNATSFTDTIAKQLLCSSAAQSFLISKVTTGPNASFSSTDLLAYESECCLIPNQQCSGSLALGGDISGSLTGANSALSVISNKMTDLTNAFDGYNLWSTAGANAGAFTSIWSTASSYFVKTCLTSCSIDAADALNETNARTYTYSPHPDQVLYKAWNILATERAGEAFMEAFTYKALPESICPYDPEYCILLPGVAMAELSNNYCTFEMTNDIKNAVGDALSSSWSALGGDSFVESATETFGAWFGDFEQSVDTFILTCLTCFVVGLVYLVVLRFTVKFCVWFAVVLIFLALAFGGTLAYVRAIQCKDTGLFSTAQQASVAVVVAAKTTAENVVAGREAVSEECSSATFCDDYRGVQTRSRSGYLCQAWDATTPHQHTYTSARWPSSGLNSTPGTNNNYCRNPYDPAYVNLTSVPNPPSTIWCFTTDPDTRWELCSPIGVIAPECASGYAVSGENAREAMKILAYVVWSLGGVWVLLVLCFVSRIRLAIALNKVAAQFVSNTPSVLVVPIVQAIVGCGWVLLWMFAASFLLSQVPANYTPTESYATYAEAYGTADTPGACTGKWPTGFVYQVAAAECDVQDPSTPKCWRCAPPRYIFDIRFAISFFSFLWNNAFLIALGQCMIAGAVGVWFFTPNNEKGKMWKAQALRQSNWNVWRYHAGSLAFGSFILALVQFIRYLMKYFEKQAEAQKNRVLALILRVVQCCIYCFERFIQFLNKNAYIQIAIRGTPFCTSAKKAFMIITQNLLRFGTVAILGYVIHCIGYIFIMTGTLVLGYLMLRAMHPDISPVIPMIIYGFMSYIVGKLFMNVFGLAVDTALQCVIFAEEKCPDGDFVPKCLRNVMDKSQASAIEKGEAE